MLKRFGSIFCLLHSSNCSEKTAPVTRLFFPSSLFHAFITVIWSTFKIHTESEHLTPVCTCVYQSLSHAWLLVACTLWPTRLLCPWDSRQEYRSGLPFPSPGDFPDPGIEPLSPPALQADSLLLSQLAFQLKFFTFESFPNHLTKGIPPFPLLQHS